MNYPWSNPAIWHAMNVHAPIVLAVLGLPLVCIVAITRGRSRSLRWGVVAFYLVVTASAWFAAQTGEGAMDKLPPTISAAASERINFHEWMAEKVWVLAGITTVLLLLANLPRRWARQTFTTLALVLSVTTVVWVAVAAHSGGRAVYEHGLGTIAMRDAPGAPPSAQADSRPRERAVAPTTKEVSAITTVSYSNDIKPLFAAKCAECHAGSETKSDFDISTVASIGKGGKKAGAGFVAGKPDDSAIVHYIEGRKQPRMPKGGKPLSDEEIAKVKAWIASGAVDDSSTSLAQISKDAAPTTQGVVSPEWDPQVKFNPAESVAVRRFVRMKNLAPAPALPKVENATFVNPIDQFIVAKWGDAQAKAQATTRASTQPADSMLCDDPTFVRRVFLDLIGMIPTADEARKFVENKEPDKRAKLIDALLDRTRDYAGNWVPWWEDALTSSGLFQGGVGTHGNYRRWIFDNFDENKPYDTMVQELLDPTMPNHPEKYILNDNHVRTIQSSADVSQVFLGTAIKCAGCHSHFLNDEWPQQRALAFAGFFAEKDVELIRCERKSGQFVQTHFMFDLPAAPTTAPIDPKIRLKRVAQLITDPTNPRFAKTIVNRLWKRYMGLGLFEPADDYREDTPPSHPELLEWLAHDFIENGYDVKHTIRLILNSRTYQLRYDPALEDHFDVAKPKEPRYYRSPSLRRLTLEQLLDSVMVTMAQQLPEKRTYQVDESTSLSRSLGKPPTRNEVSTQRPDDTAVVQALEFLNGPEYHEKVYKGDFVTNGSTEERIEALVDEVYWSALSRAPTEKEKAAGLAFLKDAPKPPATQPVEVVWLEDAIPPRARQVGMWKFAGPPDQPIFNGKRSHTEADPAPVQLQHHVTGVRFPVAPKDVLFAYVFIDPQSLPKEIMLQFHDGSEWRRATWGANEIPFAPKVSMGALPKAGEWVRLEVPAEKIGIAKPGSITGLSFDQVGGKVYWDKSGAARGLPVTAPETIGDMLWALFTSPEFQYIR